MNWNQVEGKWKRFTGSARERWGKLTANDWERISGRNDQLAGWIQERSGVAKGEADKQAGKWSRALKQSSRERHTATVSSVRRVTIWLAKRSLSRVAGLWCRWMHAEPMWPSHGHYECRKCGRRRPVAWEQPLPVPLRTPALPRETAVRDTLVTATQSRIQCS
jgi:uncharacterized protein YjbJ (UPF0337 family)